MLVIPSEIVSSVTASLFDFIWCKKPDKIKRQVMHQDYVDGGLRVPNMEVIAKSLKLAWISKFLSMCCQGELEGELESNSLSFF